MILLSAMIGLSAAVLLLTIGYILGAKRAHSAREELRNQNLAQAEKMKQLREHLSQQDDSLRATIQQVLTPLVRREQLAFELANLEAKQGQSDLTVLLNQIAEKAHFATVLLSDDEGWPLAANSSTRDLERLGATALLLLLLADRLGRDGALAPLALMLLDETNNVILCRIFHIDGQRLSLTAVSGDAQLTPTALDPALVKVKAILSNRKKLPDLDAALTNDSPSPIA